MPLQTVIQKLARFNISKRLEKILKVFVFSYFAVFTLSSLIQSHNGYRLVEIRNSPAPIVDNNSNHSDNENVIINEFEKLYPNCNLLWSNSISQKSVQSAMNKSDHALASVLSSDGKFPECVNYFQKRVHLYSPGEITEGEKNFPLGFSLIVDRNFDRVEQLFMSIYRTNNFYCFHVDKSADDQFKAQVRYKVIVYSALIILFKKGSPKKLKLKETSTSNYRQVNFSPDLELCSCHLLNLSAFCTSWL